MVFSLGWEPFLFVPTIVLHDLHCKRLLFYFHLKLRTFYYILVFASCKFWFLLNDVYNFRIAIKVCWIRCLWFLFYNPIMDRQGDIYLAPTKSNCCWQSIPSTHPTYYGQDVSSLRNGFIIAIHFKLQCLWVKYGFTAILKWFRPFLFEDKNGFNLLNLNLA